MNLFVFQRHPPTVQEEAAFMKAYDSPSDSREGQSPIHSNPGDAGTSGSDSSLKQFKPKRKRTRSCAASFSTEAVKSKLAALREARRSSKLQDIEKQRKGLPVAQHRLEKSQCALLCGGWYEQKKNSMNLLN